MYVLIKNDAVETYPYSVQQLYADNPNTSFPSPTPNSTLADFGVFPVVPTPQPAYDPVTQNLTEIDPVQVDGLWVQQWSVTQASTEEVAERKEQLKLDNKAQASSLLQQTDWTQVADCPLINKQQFIDYRAVVRAIAINPPVESAIFPELPEEQWSTV